MHLNNFLNMLEQLQVTCKSIKEIMNETLIDLIVFLFVLILWTSYQVQTICQNLIFGHPDIKFWNTYKVFSENRTCLGFIYGRKN